MNVKIYGAGSAGNHLAHAFSHLGWNVFMTDIDTDALDRTKHNIFPSRYGKWNEKIEFVDLEYLPSKPLDLSVIATPPNTHIEMAIKSIKHDLPKAILIEKPLSKPSMEGIEELQQIIKESNTMAFVGYNHNLTKSGNHFLNYLSSNDLGEIQSIRVSIKESWDGILKAHPWLKGPHDSYLGFSKLGGGALCEHSHGLSLCLQIIKNLNLGELTQIDHSFNFHTSDQLEYDRSTHLGLHTDKGGYAEVLQDLTFMKAEKIAEIQTSTQLIKYNINKKSNVDSIEIITSEGKNIKEFNKSRPDDFIPQARHIEACLLSKADYHTSPIHFNSGLETLKIIIIAFENYHNRKN